MMESYKGVSPTVDEEAWVHDNAVLIGDVQVGPRANVWPGCVLRGDQGAIVIGEETSIKMEPWPTARVACRRRLLAPAVLSVTE